jgi:hypothetical protein
MNRRRGPACVLPRCPFFPLASLIPTRTLQHVSRSSYACTSYLLLLSCIPSGRGAQGGVTIKPASLQEADMTPCVDRVKDGCVARKQASKQRAGRKTPWPIVGGPRSRAKHRKLKRPVWVWSGSALSPDPNTALLYPTRQDLGVLAVGSLLLFQSVETVSQQKLCTRLCQSRWMVCLLPSSRILLPLVTTKCLRYRCKLRNLRARSKDEDWQRAWNASRRTTYGEHDIASLTLRGLHLRI